MHLNFRAFEEHHFAEYAEWYADAELERQLGPMDQEWLEAVLAEEPGRQFVVYSGDVMVAVLGLAFEDAEPRSYVTDLAVNPAHRRQGVARAVLDRVAELRPLTEASSWHAFVDHDNPAAQALFANAGWRQLPGGPDAKGMFEFVRELPAGKDR